MTKHEEIATLAAFRASLPTDSYLRPWLDNVFIGVQDAILDDVAPMATYQSARATASSIIMEAEQAAKDIVAKAEAQALEIVGRAESRAKITRDRLIEAINAARNSL